MGGPLKKKSLETIGVKELKNRASEVIAWVQRTGQPVLVTKNNQKVAQVMPLLMDSHQQLMASGLVRPARVSQPWTASGLPSLGESRAAVKAILEDRDQ